MVLPPFDYLGYAIGLLSIIISVILYKRSQKKHKERLARLLDPHIIHQDLLKCRQKIIRHNSKFIGGFLKILQPSTDTLHELRILQQTIRNVQRYILVVRSENYEQYDRLLAEALEFLKGGEYQTGIQTLNEAIALLAAEARVMSE